MLTAWQRIADGTRESYRCFQTACENLEQAQFDCLTDILRINAASEFGQRSGFASITSIEDYRKRVPVCSYDDIAGDIDAQARGIDRLCTEPVRFFEETGGSTGGAKLIPFTDNALRSMQRSIDAWLFDLIEHRPGIAEGPGYWSISPAARPKRATSSGTPIGSDSDLAFLREDLQQAFAATLVTPADIAELADFEQWQLTTLLSLLKSENLRLVSVWSPTFLTALVDAIPAQSDRLQARLRNCNNPVSMAASQRLQQALANGELNTRCLWPNLDTISCWTHGPAAGPANELAVLFPDVHMQAKGLLATEGIVSIPQSAASMPVLAVQSGFFEFVDEHGNCFLAHELESGNAYKVILTTWSGLYRYDLGDTVLVHGRHREAPMFEFVGRDGVVSDICGEKFSDAFVSRCLADVDGFSLLAPEKKGYRLIVDGRLFAKNEVALLETRIEKKLTANPQYEYARRLGQLDPLSAIRVDRPAEYHYQRKAKLGQKLGDVKPIALCMDAELAAGLSNRELR